MKIPGKISITLLLALTSLITLAQQPDSVKTRPVQVSFAYPLASNGISSLKYSNLFSLNIIYGLNGGCDALEIGSVLNYNAGNVRGVQVGGVFNINKGNTKGIQISGVSNINAGETKGIQVGGVFNINKGATTAIQLATVNIAASSFKGIQVGVFNISKKLNGIQLGVINVTGDGEKGLPVGLITIARNGHYELEVTGGEAIYANLNFKMGVDRFYTIYKAGLSAFNQAQVKSLGIGFGSLLHFNEKNKLSIDLSASQLVYKDEWRGDNLLNRLDVNYKRALLPGLSVLVGPSFNVYVTETIINGEYGTLDIPSRLYSHLSSGSNTTMWIGGNIGLSYEIQ